MFVVSVYSVDYYGSIQGNYGEGCMKCGEYDLQNAIFFRLV